MQIVAPAASSGTFIPAGGGEFSETPSRPLRAAMSLDVATVETMARLHGDRPLGIAAAAWLGTYRSALHLGFGELVARQQAAQSWDAATGDETPPLLPAPCPPTYRGVGISPAGHAWLVAYNLARHLGFAECVAQRQAFAAADAVQGARPC